MALTLASVGISNSLSVIWKSPLIPLDPITYRKDLSRELKAKIKGFFLAYGRFGNQEEVTRARKVLAAMQLGSFVDSSNTQLYPIRQLALFKTKLSTENNDKLSADEKAARVKEIDAKLETLKVLADNVGK